jgi:AbrB family looped-hinge helix DNA binding protein
MMTTLQIRSKGTITLPARLRKKYDLEEGDILTLIDMGDGNFMLTSKNSSFLRNADKVAKAVADADVTLEELLETLDEERQRYYQEHYVEK